MFKKSIICSAALGIWAAALLLGCETLSYYSQLAGGQLGIINGGRSIQAMIADPATGDPLKAKLETVLAIRQFAADELYLPVGSHYLSYVDLNRPYVLWNVFAAPEFSLTPHTWWYPLVGQAAYRGYFARKDADQMASKLQQQGLDTHVAGVTAYSTLGWFDDPVLNTMLHRHDIGLAALIFHELAHQKLFIKGDTAFNESFASAVEQEGLRRWLKDRHAGTAFQRYRTARRRHHQFLQLVAAGRKQLDDLYQTGLTNDAKRRLKADIFDSLRSEYRLLKCEWGGYDGYDGWFAEPLNNAKLSAVAVYHDLAPAFLALLRHHRNDLSAFYEASRQIAGMPQVQRHMALEQYLDAACDPIPPRFIRQR